MATKLSNELREEFAANPHQAVPLIDDQSGNVYYFVDDEFQFGQIEPNEESRLRLRELIEEVLASGEVSAKEAHANIRGMIDKYRHV